ncbi:unnamed protein product [Adineta steineri]|uniref:Uncharacterized protein n=1 Tax=Adineta steineri TaxID=433720 RepID=A0A813N496_9BILA|nr:unnamed protein product [Adineta steineri]CAF3767192.1 unnamed protein product [Adineta steineri]
MALQNRPLLYTATGLLVIIAVLYITANALPIWVTVSDESFSYTVGLWKACESEGKNIYSLAKGLAIAALICGIIGVAIGISVVLEGIDFGGKMGVSCVLAIIALVFNFAGAIAIFYIK